MKYVRNVNDLKQYTFDFFDSFLSQDLSDKMVNYFLLGLGNEKELLSSSSQVLQNKDVKKEIFAEYGEVILQLNDYREILKRFIELILLSKKFEYLSIFLSRIFLQQIGDVKYKSSKKEYSIKERYFDRFVEIINYCNIDKNLYTPFFLEIFNCDGSSSMYDFKEPLKEYLDIFLKNGDEEFISKLLSSDNKSGLNEYANKNTFRTLSILISGFINGEITNSSIIKKALENHKQEGFNIIETFLQNESSDIKFKAVQILLLFREDRRVKDRLKYLYENTEDSKIKNILEREYNFNALEKFNTKEEFDDYVLKNTFQIQERLYGARLKRYYERENLNNKGLEGKTLTFIMETFKKRDCDTQLSYFKEYFKFVDKRILESLSKVVFDVAIYRNKLLSSKWAMRLIAVFASKELLISVAEELEIWFSNLRTINSAKYFLELLADLGRKELVDICKILLICDLDKKQKRFLENKIAELSKNSNQNIEEVKDKLSNDLNFNENGERIFDLGNRKIMAKIELDCSISIFNVKTNKPARLKDDIKYGDISLKKYIKDMEKQVKNQRKRLKTSFLEFRKYNLETFKECILENPLLNFLSQNLLWGRYRKDKLAEICCLKDGNLIHLAGNLILENLDDYQIALLQPIDCQNQKSRLKEIMGQTLFNQLDYPYFNIEDYGSNSTSVDSFCGVFCSARLFVTRLEKIKYKINDLDDKNMYSTLVKENKNLNLLTSVEFEKLILNHEDNSTTISKVRFFDLNRISKTGKIYNIDKREAKALNEIDLHVFSNELAQIFLACKN